MLPRRQSATDFLPNANEKKTEYKRGQKDRLNCRAGVAFWKRLAMGAIKGSYKHQQTRKCLGLNSSNQTFVPQNQSLQEATTHDHRNVDGKPVSEPRVKGEILVLSF
jgi:hypothetical protein